MMRPGRPTPTGSSPGFARGAIKARRPGPDPRSRAGEEASPVELGKTELHSDLDDHTYRGELPAPSASAIQADSGSTLQALLLEVVALDGESDRGTRRPSSFNCSTTLPSLSTRVPTRDGWPSSRPPRAAGS